MWGRLRGGAATPALVYYSGINWTAIAAIATLWEVYYQVRCVRQGSLPMHVCAWRRGISGGCIFGRGP